MKIFSPAAVEFLEDQRVILEDMMSEIAEYRDQCTDGEDTWARLQNAIAYLSAAMEQLDPGSSIP